MSRVAEVLTEIVVFWKCDQGVGCVNPLDFKPTRTLVGRYGAASLKC